MNRLFIIIIMLLFPFYILGKQQIYIDFGYIKAGGTKNSHYIKIYEDVDAHVSFVLKHNSDIELILEGYPYCDSGTFTGIDYGATRLINERTNEIIPVTQDGDNCLMVVRYQCLPAGYYRLDTQYASSCYPYYEFNAYLSVRNLDFSTELEDEYASNEDNYGDTDSTELETDYFNGVYTSQYMDNFNLSFSSGRSHILSRKYTTSTKSGKLDVVTYYDGLGRAEQKVHVGVTPSGADLSMHSEYDGLGRLFRVRLPVSVSSNGAYSTLSTTQNRASVLYPSETVPYSLAIYESSNRITEAYGPGEQWHNNGHSAKKNYLTNITNNDTLNCIYYKITDLGDAGISLTKVDNYASGKLYVTRVTNEDGNALFEFRNKLQQVVLIRQIQRTDGVSDRFDTYYIYDQYGNMKMVLPPLAADVFLVNGTWENTSTATLQEYAYLYKYDTQNRCIAKKNPGTDWIYYVYDKIDRLVFTQHGEQRSGNEWTFYKYDVSGRQVMSGEVIINRTHAALRGICESLISVEKFSGNADWGYTWNSLQGLVDPGTCKRILTVNYYDNYLFKSLTAFNQESFSYTAEEAEYNTRYGNDNSRFKHKGLLTGIVTALLDGSIPANETSFDYAVMYYDEHDRPIQTKSTNYLTGGFEKDCIAYNFAGQPTQKKHIHAATGKTTQTEFYTYTYDHAERLTKVEHQLQAGTTLNNKVTLAEYVYDELGRVQTKRLHGNTVNPITYTYNIRSWLTSIASNHFTQNLYYNTGYGTPRYNGNISSMTWKAGTESTQRGYKFSYDGLERLTQATYGEGTTIATNTDRFTEKVTGYDKHGNITALQRYGKTSASTYGLIDNLNFGYTGNQMKYVNDAVTTNPVGQTFHFVNGTNSTDEEYLYDANGNMTKDLNKNITNIRYNLLNLPTSVQLSDNRSATYLYDATGIKRNVTHQGGAISKSTDYCGNVIYENGVLSKILTEEGYITLSGTTPTYHYYLKDHLGNNRVILNQNGSTVEQVNHYYPFGGLFDQTSEELQAYKFGGKELDRTYGIDLYDYSARYMEPALGRFTTMDPHAESYYAWSPYHYAGNNPVNITDPTGTDWYTNDNGNYFWQEGNKKINGYTNLGSSFSIQTGENSYINYYQNAGIKANQAIDAFDLIAQSNKLQNDLLGKNSVLSKESQSVLFNGLISQKMDAVARPIGEAVVEYGAGALGGVAVGKAISWGIGRIAGAVGKTMNFTKGGASFWPAANGGRAVINGVEYTTHALERMQPVGIIMDGTQLFSRGIPPSAVENAIKYGTIIPGKTAAEVVRTFENVRIITNPAGTKVISVIKLSH